MGRGVWAPKSSDQRLRGTRMGAQGKDVPETEQGAARGLLVQKDMARFGEAHEGGREGR